MKHKMKPKPILTKKKRAILKHMMLLTLPLLFGFGIVMKSKPTLVCGAVAGAIAGLLLLVDWIIRKRTAFGSCNVGKATLKPMK